MLNKVKLYSLKKSIEKKLLTRDISQRNTPLKYLGFLVDETLLDDWEIFFEFASELGLQRKDVKLFSFVETKRKIPSLRQNQISNKEFTWRGDIHNQNAREFLDFQFDVLVGVYNGEQQFLDAMTAESKAKFKIGFQGADNRLFDLMLAVAPSDFSAVKVEMKKYLTILKKI